MIPRTYPSVLTDDGQTVMRVHVLQSIAGLTEWVDYIPVQFLLTDAAGNTSDTAGSMFIENTGDPETMQSWVDYVPVWIDNAGTTPYTTNNDGYIPVYDYTGLLNLFAQGQEGVWYEVNDPNLGWRRNQLTWTEQFDNAAWTKNRASITQNATASPAGSTTADTLVEDGTNGQHFVSQSVTLAAAPYSVTCYFKAKERSIGVISFSSFRVNFDLDAEAVTDASGSPTATSIVSVGDGWYRCSVVGTPTAGATTIYFSMATSPTAWGYTGDGTSGIYIWGAQVEQASTASDYQRITDGNTADFTDLTGTIPTLYQDSTGTTPCSTPGQGVAMPVGLMLDKHKGLVLGDELVTNGDFSDGTTGWNAGDAGTSLSVTSGVLKITNGDATPAYVVCSTAIVPVVGKSYLVTYTVLSKPSSVATGARLLFGGSDITGITPGTYSRVITATSTGNLTLSNGNTGVTSEYSEWDNISVREVPGNHAYQSTSASRPALSGRYNLLTYTEQFDNAYWVKLNATVTANATTAPDGTSTADKLVETSATGLHRAIAGFNLPAIPYTISVFLKAAERGFAFLMANTDQQVVSVNLTTGEVTTAAGSPNKVTVVESPEGSGWWLVSFEFTGVNLSANYGVLASTDGVWANRSYTGDGSSGIYIWGADLRVSNDSLNIPSYQRVVDALTYDTTGFPLYLSCDGVDDGMVTNSIDFSTVTSDGQARRNLLTYPSAFDDAYWGKTNATVTANATTAPDGTTTADKLVEAATTTSHFVAQPITFLASTQYTISVDAKADDRSFLQITSSTNLSGSGLTYQNYDLSSGVLDGSVGGRTATITALGNGWYRCTYTDTSISAGVGQFIIAVSDSGTAGRLPSYTGDGSSGIYLWGAQVETGSSATDFQDIGTDKMFVAAGVRKLSDAAFSPFVELSDASGGLISAFNMSAPGTTSTANFGFYSKGTVGVEPKASGYASPISTVLVGTGDISGDSAVLRVNGVQAASSTSDQGAGNYGNYPLYLFRRGGSSLPYNGRFYNLVVRGGALPSDTQVAQVETYLNRTTQAYEDPGNGAMSLELDFITETYYTRSI